MTADGRYKLFGVYVSKPVRDALATYLYEEAGVVEFEGYFDADASAVPEGDPGGDATDALVSTVVADFASLYDASDFDAARAVDPNSFVLAHLAAEPGTVANARERFQAAATIQDVDLRTVHTAILDAQLPEAEDGRFGPDGPQREFEPDDDGLE
ncbi:hypothetical protein [Natrarchaeobius oligotrophus]|uniref:hypothetical protein n=1 Tax=Natrarchaeobius oligotrophus TaxID=3455743 RepID=UPI001FB2D912|nr:hypothetical protein [Natrarchaeobius chitinivorans]